MPAKPSLRRLAALSLRQIHTELRRRARRGATLQRRRNRLARRIEVLDEQIRSMGGVTGPSMASVGRRRRGSNRVTLADTLQKVLTGKAMRVTDAAEAVKQAGYKTESKSFRVQVNIALIKHPEQFRRVGRGQYTAR